MNYVSVSYAVDWRLDFAKNYVWTKEGKCINAKTGKELKKCYKNGMIGYYVNGKFHSLTSLRKCLEKIPKQPCPF